MLKNGGILTPEHRLFAAEWKLERGYEVAREKTMKVVITFHTTTMAMKMEQSAKQAGSPGRLIPVPRQISAGCGMAWSAPAEDRPGIERLIRESGIEADSTYELFL